MTDAAPKTAVQTTILFHTTANEEDVSAYSLEVLEEVMRKAGVTQVMISSTSRNAYNQARVMFNNIEAKGVEHQKELYGRHGDQVIDTYSSAGTAATEQKLTGTARRDYMITKMKAKIDAVGPSRVSRHAADSSKSNVFDVGPNSIQPQSKKADFATQAKADARVSRFLEPPADPGYHFEIPQKAAIPSTTTSTTPVQALPH